MDDIRKINSMHFYWLWRNFAVSLLCIVVDIVATHMLPCFLAPAVSLFICAVLYTIVLNNESEEHPACMVVMQTTFYCILVYTVIAIIIVVVNDIWSFMPLPKELSFFSNPYLPALILMPVSFVVSLYACLFKKSMPACRMCRMHYGNVHDRGYYGFVSVHETDLQLKNMVGLFALLSVVVWAYYHFSYVDVNQNARDWYVFVWVVVLFVILDEVYFMIRYFNFFLDLEENDEIVTPEQLNNMQAITYLRFYVICGEDIFINTNATDRINQSVGICDTPFIVKRTVDGINDTYLRSILTDLTGVDDGELRHFYGRHIQGAEKYFMLRYFYFLSGDKSQYQNFNAKGEWVPFSKIKRMYANEPMKLSVNALADISRLSTIIMTEKEYDENGMRKNPIKSYRHDITLADVRDSNIDMQDDKWIRIADFNSDTRFFRLRRLLRRFTGKSRYNKDVNC